MRVNNIKPLLFIAILLLLISSCTATKTVDTIASLNDIKFEVKEERVDNSLEKAMASYAMFLKETQDTRMTPESMRRLGDLKLQQEHEVAEQIQQQVGERFLQGDITSYGESEESLQAVAGSMKQPEKVTGIENLTVEARGYTRSKVIEGSAVADVIEDENIFRERATKKLDLSNRGGKTGNVFINDPDDLQVASAKEAIELYKELLKKHPLFERNDQVLYQLSRAYEEIGEVDMAMLTLEQLIENYPKSRHVDEAWFRRAEYFFTRRKFLDAEESYAAVIAVGKVSTFYELAVYKRGWSFFKQELYEEALKDFIRLLDYKIDRGVQLDSVGSKIEKKRITDTYRVISLSFSALGGSDAVKAFFDEHGQRVYEASIYSHLGEHYLSKRRFSDAAQSYRAYIKRNPISRESPYFNIRIIEIYMEGGFPSLIVDAKRAFSKTYSLQSDFWTFFDINEHPVIHAFLKSNLVDLANHYHALYQDERLEKQKQENFIEAIYWYRAFLASFTEEKEAPKLNKQLADLLLEHKDYLAAAIEYERTAYHYPLHEYSSNAGFAAVFAYREYLKVVAQSQRGAIKREIIRSSIKFSEKFSEHKDAALVLVAAVDDLYSLESYQLAIQYGRQAIRDFPNADNEILHSAWLVVAHASFDTANYSDAEIAYKEALQIIGNEDNRHRVLTENLAASIYKQGEQAKTLGEHAVAAKHFLRVGKVAPNSVIRAIAEYDAAASLMLAKKWGAVATVLEEFRKLFPEDALNNSVTKRLAIVYKEDGKYLKSAAEFERIEKENPDDRALRHEALSHAAELYMKVESHEKALLVYKNLVSYFPRPIELALEIRQKMAEIYLMKGEGEKHIAELKKIVSTDATGGVGRTDRTKFLAAHAGLILAEKKYIAFEGVALVKPFQKNLKTKKRLMRSAIDAYSELVAYQVGEVTAAATFFIAEIYYEFSIALLESERPDNLNAAELEEYEMVIEDQAFPFEEKSIRVHEKNMELLDVGVYNQWIDKSLKKLSVLLPARYGKTEINSAIVLLIQPRKNKNTASQSSRLDGTSKKNEALNSRVLEGEVNADTVADPVLEMPNKQAVTGG